METVLIRRIQQCFRFHFMLDWPLSLPSLSLSVFLSVSRSLVDLLMLLSLSQSPANGSTMADNAVWIRNFCVCAWGGGMGGACGRVCTCVCACLAGKCTSVSIQAHLWHIPRPWSLCGAVALLSGLCLRIMACLLWSPAPALERCGPKMFYLLSGLASIKLMESIQLSPIPFRPEPQKNTLTGS